MLAKPLQKLSARKVFTPTLDKFIAFLDSLPNDEVLDTQEISKLNVVSRNSLLRWAAYEPRLSFYCYLIPGGRGSCPGSYIFGNPQAIIAARKEVKKKLGGK